MRILLTSNYKMGNETGSSHVTDLLAINLSKKHSVCYLCLGEKFNIKKYFKKLTIITIPSVEINSISFPIITPNTVLKLESFITEYSPDIVHTQNSVMVAKLMQIWANQKQIPIITTFHYIPTQTFKHLLPKLSKNIFAKVIEDLYTQTSLKLFLNKINGVIALNENQKKEIRSVDKKLKIALINNGLDLTEYKKIKSKKPGKIINFVFMGSYTERKNQEFLVKAFKHLPQNYLLTCFGKISTGKKYYEKIKSIKPENVILADYTKDVAETLKKFDFFISASLKEVQSLAVIYAMAAGLPVIGTENETISELTNSSNGLKLNKNISSKEFAKKVSIFVEKCNYQKLSEKAKNDTERFEINKVIPRIEKFYNEVVSET